MMEQESQHREISQWIVTKKVAKEPVKTVDVKLKTNNTKVVTLHNDIFSNNRYMPLSFGQNSTLVEDERSLSLSESKVVPVERQNAKALTMEDSRSKTGYIAEQQSEVDLY